MDTPNGSASSTAEDSVLCAGLLSLLGPPSSSSESPQEFDRSRFGSVINGIAPDALPHSIRDDLLMLRDVLRPFELDPSLTWDDFSETLAADARKSAVAATQRVNLWVVANCDLAAIYRATEGTPPN